MFLHRSGICLAKKAWLKNGCGRYRSRHGGSFALIIEKILHQKR
ncbi:hypothetical protein HMPREF9555_00994 [Selenomonas artemidis F0399]|uniref:Uncharacterized protein n=1 Tax=Selenomonas artemidis F0399 TaxID=749551 RepID=E7N1Y4_9FIRM|nr:hypothetical protein HMPREF9555_00994 [Selenomonas artemidis F0399]EJP34031.1 hypothetical protein HMPREF1147_0545 [Selenomonas sp. FOBRC9]